MRTVCCFAWMSALLVGQVSLTPTLVKVRVHPDEAWLTRQVTTRLEGPGTHAFILKGLPAGLTPGDVRLRVQGPEGAALGDLRLEPCSEYADMGKRNLDRPKELKTRLEETEAKMEVLKAEEAFLRRMLEQRASEAGVRLFDQASATQATLEASRQVHLRLLKGRKLQGELNDLRAELALMERNAKLREANPKRTTEARFQVRTPVAGPLHIVLETRTKEARWKPDYEANFSAEGRRLELSLLATVTQQSGEDWSEVQVELTTAKARQGSAPPQVPRSLEVGWVAPVQVVRSKDVVPDIVSQSMASMDSGYRSPVTPAGAGVATANPAPRPVPLLEPASQVLLRAGTATTFLLDGKKRVPGNAQSQRFLVRTVAATPTMVHLAVPRQSAEVHLLARFPLPEDLPFFPGADLVPIFGGQRLGAIALERPRADEPFGMPLGVFEGMQARLDRLEATSPQRLVKVTRTKGEEVREEVGVGKVQRWALGERLLVENTTGETLEVEVLDRPVRSTHEKVQITFQAQPKPDRTTTEAHRWRLKVPARGTATITLDTSVKGPKEGHATGLGALGFDEE